MGDYDEEYEDIPAEEKLAIVRYFITHTPPGHTDTIINSVKKLGCADILDETMINTMMHEYNTSNLVSVNGPDGSEDKLVICSETEIDPNSYLHPSTGKVVTFDHIKCEAGASRDATPAENPSTHEATRKVLQKAATKYVHDNYDKAGSGAVVTEQDSRLSVVISSQVVKYSAYWSGRWKSEWTIQESGGSATVEGTITVMAHYYENGNVQLHNLKDVPSTTLSGSGDALAQAFVLHVKKTEDALHDEYQRMFSSMKDTTFKELRRALPITGVKFPWHNPGLGSMAMGKDAAAASKA
jgi:capping protein alpha